MSMSTPLPTMMVDSRPTAVPAANLRLRSSVEQSNPWLCRKSVSQRSTDNRLLLGRISLLFLLSPLAVQKSTDGTFIREAHALSVPPPSSVPSSRRGEEKTKERVAVVGGGISGLVVSHVLQQSGRYDAVLFEAEDRLGGNIRGAPDPREGRGDDGGVPPPRLNIGHATHLGMFANLRLLLRYLGVEERPVGRGPNDVPGLFRMLSVACGRGSGDGGADADGGRGRIVQPPLEHVTSPRVWWEAFVFYYRSYLEPDVRLGDFLRRNRFDGRFLDVLYWSMATFEFDKTADECGEYALGAARALLITQVFFKYLLCDAFRGRLPPKIDGGLREDLKRRVRSVCRDAAEAERLARILDDDYGDDGRGGAAGPAPLASYFTADYGRAVEGLARGAGDVRAGSAVRRVSRCDDGDGDAPGRLAVETEDGRRTVVDSVVFTMQPPRIADILEEEDFRGHVDALRDVDMGAVGVKIMHASDLPFAYPPTGDTPAVPFDRNSPVPILGIFDISELTTYADGTEPGRDGAREAEADDPAPCPGCLSVAYPVYSDDDRKNVHRSSLSSVPHLDETVYPWTRATSSFPRARRALTDLQGAGGVYVVGHSLTGVNKASELQVTHALELCRVHFGAAPPWGDFSFPVAMLPDCNDDDAFRRAGSPLEAARWAWKGLVGSFLLVGAVSALGAELFE